EIRQMFRDPKMRFLMVLPPIVQLILFGYAVNLDVEKVKIAWMDRDLTAESRDILGAFQGSGRFEVLALPDSEDDVQRLLGSGRVQGVVRVMRGFARDIRRGETASVQVLIEGTNSNTAGIVQNYASTVIADYADRLRAEKGGASHGLTPRS